MNPGSEVAMLDRDTPTLAERVKAILRDEIANGALANIAAARQVWSAHRRGFITREMARRSEAEFFGPWDTVLDTVLDLLVPPSRSSAALSLARATAGLDHNPEPARQTIEYLPVLRALRSVPPGATAGIHTGLRNDGPTPVEVGFVWSDLVAEPDGRIHAGCLRLPPGRVRIPPGGSVDVAIDLDVPDGARPGLYHALLESTEPLGLQALLTFPVHLAG